MSSNIAYRPASSEESLDFAASKAVNVTADAMQVDDKSEMDTQTSVSLNHGQMTVNHSDTPLQTDQQVLAEVHEPSWSFSDLGAGPSATSLSAPNTSSDEGSALESDMMEGIVAATSENPLPPIADHFDGDQMLAQQLANEANAGNNSVEDAEDGAEDQDSQHANQNAQAAQVPNTDHFVWVDRGDAVEESSDCKLCMTTPGLDDDPLYVECGHVWCKSCLNQYFAQSFTDRDQFPPRCCRPEGFDLEVIGMHLEDEILIHVMDKWEEWTAKDPTYCSNMQCNVFVPEYRVDGQWGVCLNCKVKTCVECKEGEARHPTPDQHPEPEKDEENAKLAETEGWKYCPNKKCNKIVEKIEGCDTMTCKCGQQFCYRCGNGLEGYPCTCNGENAWVGQVQAWANGADGDQANADGDDDAENEGDSESESDEEEEESDSDDGEVAEDVEEDEDEEEENDDAAGEDDDV